MPDTVMLIHDAGLTPAAWDRVRRRFGLLGYTVLAPAWPHADMPLDRLRQWPPRPLAALTLGGLVAHHAQLARALEAPPILVGHGVGGLVVQLLLDRGIGRAGVALASAPITSGLPSPVGAIRALHALGGWRRPRQMTFARFARDVAQTLPETEKRPAYDLYVAPAPGRLTLQVAAGIGAHVRAGNPKRAPLLLAVGDKDRTIHPSRVRAAYRMQRRAPSPTALEIFPGRSHFLIAEPGWEEVADFAIGWTRTHAAA